MRQNLTPAFTPGKIKTMFPLMMKCLEDLKDYFERAAMSQKVVETRKIMTSFTLDVIASCAFGLEISCIKNSHSEFQDIVDNIILRPNFFRLLSNGINFLAPKLFTSLRVKPTPPKVTDYIMKITEDTVEFREKNNTHRNDLMQLLIELKKTGKINCTDSPVEVTDGDTNFTIEQIAAQLYIFFIAGYETSASTLMFCLFELTLNLSMQDKLREEIDFITNKYGGEITYDGIQEMEYLDRVVSETLRKYPVVSDIFRTAMKSYYMPELDSVIEKDTRIFISVLGLHHDPDYWPDPQKFDPDRFLPENKEKRDPMCYMPFGVGPRNCIGLRFGLLETKLALSVILSNFKIFLSEKTTVPLEFNPRSPILMNVKEEVYLKIEKR